MDLLGPDIYHCMHFDVTKRPRAETLVLVRGRFTSRPTAHLLGNFGRLLIKITSQPSAAKPSVTYGLILGFALQGQISCKANIY